LLPVDKLGDAAALRAAGIVGIASVAGETAASPRPAAGPQAAVPAAANGGAARSAPAVDGRSRARDTRERETRR
jgi:hypothetical protein